MISSKRLMYVLGMMLAGFSVQGAQAGSPPLTISVSGGIFDMVYDSARHLLYMTTGSSKILRYDMAAQAFLSPISIVGRLQGLDISADGSKLAVADAETVNNKVWVDIVDLATNKLSRITAPTNNGSVSGTFDAAFYNSSDVVVSGALPPGYSGAGVPMYVGNLAAGVLTQVNGPNPDQVYLTEDTVIRASPDHSVVAYTAGDISNGPWGVVKVAKATIGNFHQTNWFTYDIAVAIKGGFFAVPTYYGTFVYTRGGYALETLGTYAQTWYDSAVFDTVRPSVLYQSLAEAAQIDVFNVTTGKLLRSISTGITLPAEGNSSFGPGTLRIASDDTYLFMNSGSGVVAMTLH